MAALAQRQINASSTTVEKPLNGKPTNQNHEPRTNYSDPNGSGDKSPPPQVDPVDEIFALGLPILTQAGIKEPSARSFLGLMRKQSNDDAKVVNAIRKCVEEKPLHPIEYLQGLLGKKPGNAKLSVKHQGGSVVEHA